MAPGAGVPALSLRVVGGLGALPAYTRHERPFWTETLPRLTVGRVRGYAVAFDEAGISGSELLRLIQSGAVTVGTALLPLAAVQDPELGAADLAGRNPDMASMRRHAAAFRPHFGGPAAHPVGRRAAGAVR